MYFGGYLNENWHAFIVYMFRQRPEVLHSVGDNALISGLGKGPISSMQKLLLQYEFELEVTTRISEINENDNLR